MVPLTNGTLKLEEPNGSRSVRLEVGASYARPAGVSHNVINENPHEFRFVEIELGGRVSKIPGPADGMRISRPQTYRVEDKDLP